MEKQRIYPLGDSKGFIELVDFMGGDLDVVNDARQSYDKQSEGFGEREARLVNYLLSPIDKPQHTSPLRGTVLKFRVKAPLYVCRQWYKHAVASTYLDCQNQWNEKSLRYSEEEESDYYVPKVFKTQHNKNKQMSGEALPEEDQYELRHAWIVACENSWQDYKRFLAIGVSRETARGLLLPCFYTSFVWTVSLQALLHFIDLRLPQEAQSEIRMYASAIELLAQPLAPNAFGVWTNRRLIIEEAMRLYKEKHEKEDITTAGDGSTDRKAN